MSNKIINIPTELSVGMWKRMSGLEHLSDTERIVTIISALTGEKENDVMKWDILSISEIYGKINDVLTNTATVFLPIIDFKGTQWGFQPISKMSIGEYIDLENQMKGGLENLEGVLSILYRPIVESRLDGLEWKIKSQLKYVVGKSETLFKYYDVEEYDMEKSEWRTEDFKELPLSIALGAYNFFLLVGIQLSNDILTSSPQMRRTMEITEEEMKELQFQLQNIMGGSTFYKDWRKMGEYLG